MIGARAGVIACVAGITAIASAWQGQAPPTFRASVDAVRVTASVRAAGEAVAGLTAADFDVLDNGVKQAIDGVIAATLPVDVTLVVEIDYFSRSAVERSRRDVRSMAASLRPDDRFRVISSSGSSDAMIAVPWQAGGSDVVIEPVDGLVATGGSMTADMVLFALARPMAPERMQLVVAFSTARQDLRSASRYDRLPAVAAASGIVLHVVLTPPEWFAPAHVAIARATDSVDAITGGRPFMMEVMNFSASRPPPMARALGDAARASGGAVYQPTLTAPEFAVAFRQVIEDLRTSYVIYYTPRGVTRAGWHDITVRVRHPGATVRARTGYSGG